MREICDERITRDYPDTVILMANLASVGEWPSERPPLALLVSAHGQQIENRICCNYAVTECAESVKVRKLVLCHLPHGPVRTWCPRCADARLPKNWVDWLHTFNGSTALPPITPPAPIGKSAAQVAAERKEQLRAFLAGGLSHGPVDAAARIVAVIEEMIAHGR